MKKRARIVRNHPAFDKTTNRWVRIVDLHKGGVLDVAVLGNPDSRSYNVHASQVALWHPEASLNEAGAEALTCIPAGSRVTVGCTDYTRVIRGWLETEWDDLAECEYSRFIPDPGVEDKAPDRWRVGCNNHSGTPYFLEEKNGVEMEKVSR